MDNAVKINAADNVAVATAGLDKSSIYFDVVLKENVLKGHKFALVNIKKGDDVIKYGSSIGKATVNIAAGENVHTHNLKTNLDENLEYKYVKKTPAKFVLPKRIPTVNVYERKNGEIGIRNEIWVVPTVGCVNTQARLIAEAFNAKHKKSEVDGIFAFGHSYGCSQMGGDHEFTKKILQNIVLHPNAGGVLVLGLGCENNQIDAFREGLGAYDKNRIMFLNAQDTEDEIEEGVKTLEKIYAVARKDKRVSKSISVLKVGLKCGGSDGLSGITANPLLGVFSDYLTACGGATVLTEIPEMFGAEHLLMERAADVRIFNKIVELINGFKDYYRKNEQTVYENPSPGNKAGGISTLEDKSLGCVQKGGTSEITDVLFDGDVVTVSGLNLLNGPGNDMIAVTNLGAAGCHLVLFTTGRGTPLGGFIPTVKISTNDGLAARKNNWIDFNAGNGLDDVNLNKLIEFVVAAASGKQVKNEVNGSREIAIFKSGVTL